MRVRGNLRWARMALLGAVLGGLQACGGGGGAGEQTDASREQYALAISPDGRTVASGGADRTARLWDAHIGAALRTLSAPEAVQAVDYTPDSLNVVAAGVAGSVRAWSVPTGQALWAAEFSRANGWPAPAPTVRLQTIARASASKLSTGCKPMSARVPPSVVGTRHVASVVQEPYVGTSEGRSARSAS